MPKRAAIVVMPLLVATVATCVGIADAAGTRPTNLSTTVIQLKSKISTTVAFNSTHLVSYGSLTKRHPAGKGGAITYSCATASKTTSSCQASFTLKRGIILANLTVDFSNLAVNGRITGGSGSFRNASGTVTGQPGSNGTELLKLTLTS
jgi:hypothetical protein